MDLLESITENKFTLVLMDEAQYEKKLIDMVKHINQKYSKICYVCLSTPYNDVLEHLTNIQIDVHKFFFVDTLSSHYGDVEETKNCIFVKDPTDILSLQTAIKKAVSDHDCEYIIFDTISSLFLYEQSSDIVRLSHELTQERQQEVNKVFIVIKESGLIEKHSESLIKDMGMFADHTIDVAEK